MKTIFPRNVIYVMNKPICILIIMTMSICILMGCGNNHLQTEVTPTPTPTLTPTPVAVSKVYCTATLDDDFTSNEILIVIMPAWNEKEYTIENFAEVNCIALKELTYDVTKDELCRIIKLTISGDSKVNVLDAIKKLEQREDIYSAEPNYIGTFR